MGKNEVEETDRIINHSLQKIAKGAVFVFIGSILSIALAFLGRILVARNFTQSEYGIFSLGFSILSIAAVIGSMGLHDGAARQIAFYKGGGNNRKVGDTVFFSLVFGSIFGLFLTFLLFFSSGYISTVIFKDSNLIVPLRLFSVGAFFFVLLHVLTAVFRGFGTVKEKVFFEDILRNLLFLLLMCLVVFFGFSFDYVAVVFTGSIIFASVLFFIYFLLKKPSLMDNEIVKNIDFSMGKKLFLFSFPLLLVAILNQIMGWMDTLMLGFFKTAEVVGLYNAAQPLGLFVSSALSAMLFVYMPIVSDFHSKNQIHEMKRSYVILTKWLCAATFPLVTIFVFFPALVLDFLFGSEYVVAAVALQVLAIGFFINNLLGPNGATLTAMGKTHFLMYATLLAALVNVVLNFILIPYYGIVGAAIATVVALVSINVIRSVKLHALSGIHSLDKNIIKPIVLSLILVTLMYFLSKSFLTIRFWMLPVLFVLFLILYMFSLLFTKSFEKEDLEMLLTIEKKTGINLKIVKKVLNKFL